MKVTREAHVAACETLSTWSKETQTLPSVTEAENRETRGSRTTPWQSIPESFFGVSRPSCGKLAQVQRLRRGRVLHSSPGVTTGKPRRCKLPQNGAGGTDQTRSRAQSSATEQHDVDDDDQKIAVRREEANERRRRASGNQESAQKSHATEAFCSACLEHETETRSQRATGSKADRS